MVSPLAIWSPSSRVSRTFSVLWAPAVLSCVPASKRGLKGRGPPGQGAPFGPESSVKNWVEVWLEMTASQGTKVVLTG